MEKFATENLILIEFLVDHVNFEYNIKQNLDNVPGEICVSFQFLDNAPILVCEEDFNPTRKACGSSIKNGKSCLFSLTPEQAEEAESRFDVYVQVFKKTKDGNKVLIGECLISILNLFRELMESATNGETIAKTLKDCFKLNSTRGVMVGNVSIYIRMSCYGKLIVTQFQMNLEDKSVEFKAKEGHYLFKFSKKERPVESCPCIKSSNTLQTEPDNTYQAPVYQVPSTPTMYAPPVAQAYRAPSTPTCYAPPVAPEPISTCYTPTKPPPAYQPTWIPAPQTPSYQPSYASTPNQCGCHQTPRAPPFMQAPPGHTTYLTQGMNCCGYTEMNAQMGDSGALNARIQEPQKFALKSGGPNQAAPPFTFQVGGNNVCISSPVCTAPDGTKFTEISDPGREMFVLRVGKKSEGLSPSHNVDLELCTPRPAKVPELDNKRVQYQPGDLPTEYLENYYGKDEWRRLQKETGFKGGEKEKKGKGGGKGKKKK